MTDYHAEAEAEHIKALGTYHECPAPLDAPTGSGWWWWYAPGQRHATPVRLTTLPNGLIYVVEVASTQRQLLGVAATTKALGGKWCRMQQPVEIEP